MAEQEYKTKQEYEIEIIKKDQRIKDLEYSLKLMEDNIKILNGLQNQIQLIVNQAKQK